MSNKKKDFMSQLNDLDSFSVEEIAEKYPVLNESAKKRIVKKCMKKESFSADINYDGEEEIIVSETKKYHRSLWYRYGSFAAAFVLTAVTIASVIMLNMNPKDNDYYEIDRTPSVNIYDSEPYSRSDDDMPTTSERGHIGDSNYHSGNNEYPTTNADQTTQRPTSDEQPTDYNGNTEKTSADNHESQNPSPETQSHDTLINTEGFYYVKASGEDEGLIMGFSFAPDGSLTKYSFDDYGDPVNNTVLNTYYAIDGNRFSYFLSSGNLRNGTIINSNVADCFSVQFDDGQLCHFSTERPVFKTPDNVQEKTLALNGTVWGWYSDDHSENRHIEFSEDGVSGKYITIVNENTTVLFFAYEKNGDEYNIYIPASGDMISFKANLLDAGSADPTLAVKYPDKGTIYFYLTSKPD